MAVTRCVRSRTVPIWSGTRCVFVRGAIGCARFAAIAAATAATTAAARFLRLSRRIRRSRHRFGRGGVSGRLRRCSCLEYFRILLEGKTWLWDRCWQDLARTPGAGFRRCGDRSLNCRQTAHARGGFLRLGFPIGATEAFARGGIPLGGFGVLAGSFKIASELKRDHGVASFLEQIRELSHWIFAGARASDASGDLFPIGHTVAGGAL